MDLPTARERLFAVSLNRFVETPAELAAELAQQGQKDDSKKLKGIRRPTVSAWATNQVVQDAPDDVSAFFEASDDLRRVQQAMLRGQSERAAYQTAAETFRTATTLLGATIRRTLESSGKNVEPSLVERIIFRTSAWPPFPVNAAASYSVGSWRTTSPPAMRTWPVYSVRRPGVRESPIFPKPLRPRNFG